jgi:hypothetical protein
MPIAQQSKPWEGSGWRAVEAQHKNATIGLVHGNLEAQALLESIIEEAKPQLPKEAHGLHFLLSTPFRYISPPPEGSRFRGSFDWAAFYGTEDIKTACAELGYRRFRFWMDSEGLRNKPANFALTIFQWHAATKTLIDLTEKPFSDDREKWIHPTDYTATQTLGKQAREEGIEIIRFESVRNPPGGRCFALFTPVVFKAVKEPFRDQQQTWNLHIEPNGQAVWQRDLGGEAFEFKYA